jgi:hypothetical protein
VALHISPLSRNFHIAVTGWGAMEGWRGGSAFLGSGVTTGPAAGEGGVPHPARDSITISAIGKPADAERMQ